MRKKITIELSVKQSNWIDSLIQQNKEDSVESYIKNLINKDISLDDKWISVFEAIKKRVENKEDLEDF
ncbi:hypothetical protein [uncultured Maribacter sp.]|uniref:hypothetical protein n=1 Tax=uncultured Maribacter sp. TaxID=431308 RepID=UPI0026090B97|nr:hypothetical protein [uncultured Maribacter sp.]